MVDGTVRSMLMFPSAISDSGFELLSWLAVGAGSALVAWLLLLRPSARRIDALQRRGRELLDSHTRAVDELKRERDLMGSILESMSEGVLLLDAHNQVVLVNPSLRSTLLLPKEVVGKSLLETLRRPDLADLVARARSSGEPVAEEISVEGLKPRRLSVRVNPMSTPAGALLVVFFDVTEIRRLESLRRDFVANVSHELRTPVAAICSATETLLCGALQDPKAARSFVGIIERNSQRMRRLVEDLLDLSRIESKEYKLDRRELALGNVVERCVSLLRDKARQGRIRTDVEIPEELPDVFADARALEQVLVNLIENAIKYCRPGSRVVIRAVSETDRTVRCTVQDSGPGIPEAELPRLYERFYRVDAGRSRDMGGTGLGLSIVKHLVEAMGGRVGVESRIGFGSSFWFTVPTTSDEAPVSVPPLE
jgi:two-component system phosphate regulon sensor histidine kinase PhoR